MQLLTAEETQAELENAKKIARHVMMRGFRAMTVYEPGGKKGDATQLGYTSDMIVLSLFGDTVRWIIDPDKREVYTVQKNNEDKFGEPCAVSLFVRHERSMKQEMFKKIVGAMDAYMATKGMIPVADADLTIQRIANMPGRDVQKFQQILTSQRKMLNKAASTVINTCWGKSMPWEKVVRTIGKTFWSKIDRKVATIAIHMFGQTVNTNNYQLVWKHYDELAKVMQHSPGLLALGPYVADPNNLVAETKKHFDSDASGKPLSKRGWKHLLQMKPLWVRYLLTVYPYDKNHPNSSYNSGYYSHLPDNGEPNRLNNLPEVLDMLAEIGESPKFNFMLQFMRHTRGRLRTPSFVAFARAAFVESRKKPAKTFYSTDVQLAMDWFSSAPPREAGGIVVPHQPGWDRLLGRTLDANQLRADWKWFRRQEQEWHRAAAFTSQPASHAKWESATKAYTKGSFKVVPLVTGMELWEEGQKQKHCVSGYAGSCEEGHARIFSIRQKSRRVATVQIIAREEAKAIAEVQLSDEKREEYTKLGVVVLPDKCRWMLNQVRGACNSVVPANVKRLAEEVATRYTADFAKLDLEDRMRQLGYFQRAEKRLDSEADGALRRRRAFRGAYEQVGPAEPIEWDNAGQPVPPGQRAADLVW